MIFTDSNILPTRVYQLLLILVSALAPLAVSGQVYDMVVAKDGSGDYVSIQAAIEEVALNNADRTLIFVKNGVYNEKVWIYSSTKNVSLIGESKDGVVISWDDYSGKTVDMSTADSYTFLVEGNDFYGENMTIRNTAGDVGQAVAVRTTGDRQVFKNCIFEGFQDTFYAHKNRQYLLNCFIEGATDFVFGDATAVFDSCTINCVDGGQYISAPADTKLLSTTASDETFYHGMLFMNCEITADQDVADGSYYLGRPWQPGASSVFVNCSLGNHIKAEGWSEWSDNNHLLGRFAEYENKDLSGELINVSQRVAWSEQLTTEEVEAYYNLDYFLKKEGVIWDPKPIAEAPPAPDKLVASADVLSWNASGDVKGYAVIRNDSLIGFSTANSFDISFWNEETNIYRVRAINDNGNLSVPSDELLVQARITHVNSPEKLAFEVSLVRNVLLISEVVNAEVYTLSGTLIRKDNHTASLSLAGLKFGIYLVKLVNSKGQTVVKKIAI